MRRPTAKVQVTIAVVFLLVVAVTVVAILSSGPRYSPTEAVTTWIWTLWYETFPVEDDAELVALHAGDDTTSREQCVACHGDKDESLLPVHAIHLRSELLPNLDCDDCHPVVDLSPRDNTTTARWVDIAFCKTCHSEFPGLEPEHAMNDVDIEGDCTECHTGDDAPEHEQPFLPGDIEASDCIGCHGGRVLPWTPDHESEGWLDVHGMEALDSGQDACFECHDFGLKFCDECHEETPPSHLPAEPWRGNVHIEAAQTDTRVCYSCHETSHCKQCHVNHEEGWLESHVAFIDERGDESCDECHSRSSCSFCHTAEALASE